MSVTFTLQYSCSLICNVIIQLIIQMTKDKNQNYIKIKNQGRPNQAPNQRIYFEFMEKVGSMGKYQKLTVALWCIVGYLYGGIQLIIPFVFYQQPYICPQQYPGMSCKQYVCSLDQRYRSAFQPGQKLSTLANKFGDYRCNEGEIYLSAIESIIYSGFFLGALTSALLGNLFRKKVIIQTSVVISFLGYFVTIFSVSIEMAGAGIFLSYFTISLSTYIALLYVCETISEEYRAKLSVIIQLFYGFGVGSNIGTYFFIGDWKLIFILFYMVPTFVTAVGIYFIVVDTPIDLITRTTPQYALEGYKKIARFNGVINPELSIEQIEQALKIVWDNSKKASKNGNPGQNFTILHLFKFKSLQKLTLLLVLTFATIMLSFYIPALMIDQFNFSIYINALVLSVSEMAAYPLVYFMINHAKRKYIANVSFGCTFICAIILLFIWSPGAEEKVDIGANLGTLAVIFLFRFFITVEYISFLVYQQQLYPTQIRIVGTGLVCISGGVIIMTNPLIISFCNSIGLHIMYPIGFMLLASLVSSFFLQQTYNAAPPDIIEELRHKVSSFRQSVAKLSVHKISLEHDQ